MAKTLPIKVKDDFKTFGEFVAALAKRHHVRLVKVDDQGSVKPVPRGTGFVLQPRVRVVATAFDHEANVILRWQDEWDVGSGTVTLRAPSGKGSHRDPTGSRTRDQMIAELQLKSYDVTRGEWTPESIMAILAGTAEA